MFGEARAPAVTQDSIVAPPATQVAGVPNGRQWTPQSHLEASLTIGFRGDLRARSCAACDPDLSKAHPKSGRVTDRSRCPLRAQSDVIDARREMT
jgi:hypothetical protein